jgi:hypothetical protein
MGTEQHGHQRQKRLPSPQHERGYSAKHMRMPKIQNDTENAFKPLRHALPTWVRANEEAPNGQTAPRSHVLHHLSNRPKVRALSQDCGEINIEGSATSIIWTTSPQSRHHPTGRKGTAGVAFPCHSPPIRDAHQPCEQHFFTWYRDLSSVL